MDKQTALNFLEQIYSSSSSAEEKEIAYRRLKELLTVLLE